MDLYNQKLLIIGGDKRNYFLADIISQYVQRLQTYAVAGSEELTRCMQAEKLTEGISHADIVIAPMPFTKDGVHIFAAAHTVIPIAAFCAALQERQCLFAGNIPAEVAAVAEKKHIRCYDFMKMEAVAADNAICTAEGAIAEGILLSPLRLYGSEVLVLGYGRCGSAIADMLRGMGAQVTVAARDCLLEAAEAGFRCISLAALSEAACSARFIFNTIPALVLTPTVIAGLHPATVIIDIASAPGGTDFQACKAQDIAAVLSLGIPGRYAPLAAAQILAQAIFTALEE